MTALREYQRLEAPGLWRDAQGGPRREVIVALGDATLVISDGRTNRALAHWSLPAIGRANPGLVPARFAPGPDSAEDLEIDDPAMVAALSRVKHLIEARRPHPGRLRLALVLAAAALLLLSGLVWVPRALVAEAARAAPDETRAAIGRALMADVFRLTGAACTAPEGRAALERLSARLSGSGAGDLIVLATGLSGTRHLPGGAILIGRSTVEASPSPEALAGELLAEAARMDAADPLAELLAWSGARAAFGLLTTGELNPDRMVGYAEVLLTRPPAAPGVDRLADRFRQAEVDPGAWLAAAPLIPADAGELAERLAGAPGRPVMPDADWVALRDICTD
ncbi:MAG: hypothetical protein ACKVPY_17870 [Paracoccaceae bacterium]